MTLSFKTFLLQEGGHATTKYGAERATKEDILKALAIVSKTLGVNEATLKDCLLGSTLATLAGKKKDSGDIDIAISTDMNLDWDQTNQKMMELTNNEGYINKGTKIGSFAVDVGGKKVQVDLMFVASKEWAKFIYHSAQGQGSNYPGAVRNFLLFATVKFKQEAGKDVVIKNGDKVLARASRSIKLDKGLERLFKMVSVKNDGSYGEGLGKVEPKKLQATINKMAGKEVKFSHDAEIVDDPDQVAKFLFGDQVTAKDIMTPEDTIVQIKKLKNGSEILADAKKQLQDAKLPIPKEME